jgi:biopolymer transport protein ExbB
MHVQLRLRATGFLRVPEKRWRRWLDHPQERTGPIGALLERVADGSTVAETQRLFAHARESEIGPFERDLRVMRICVSAAPLVGLLGTVTGMLATFGALASGSGGEKTMGLVAGGISEALITTETGLVIALPGLFFQYQLARKTERYKAFLAHLETVLTQTVHLRQRDERQYVIQRAARGEIARALARRLQRPKAAT